MPSGVEAATARNLATVIEMKDPLTKGHARSVSRAAVTLAKELGYQDERVARIEQAALLHDVGIIDVDHRILRKPGRLSAAEFEKIRLHPVIGADMVRSIPSLADLAPFIETHHERWDGTGYPRGLKGSEIPEEGRILAVAETFDAMMSQRSHRAPFSPTKAITGLKTAARAQLDPRLVEAFIAAISRFAPLEEFERGGVRLSLDELVQREKKKIQSVFVRLAEAVWWMFSRLLGEVFIQGVEQDINGFLARHAMAVRFRDGKIEDAIPQRVLPEELADIYRAVLAREVSLFERLVGREIARQYVRTAMESLTDDGRQICREYRLCEGVA